MQKSNSIRLKDCFIAIVFLSFSCSCQKSSIKESTAAPDKTTALRAAIAESMGMAMDKVVFSKEEQVFYVEDDGSVTLEDANRRFGNNGCGQPNGVSEATQRKSYYVVKSSLVNTIKIYADYSVPATWLKALDYAIANWNKSGSKVYMQRTLNSTEASTLVTTYYNSTTLTVATSVYPDSYGKPGKKISINKYFNGMADAKKTFVVTHELGHTLGFTHTNGTFGTLINGTPLQDPNSIMNSVCLYWTAFTSYDLKAIGITYPK
jgi:hypothetical protein